MALAAYALLAGVSCSGHAQNVRARNGADLLSPITPAELQNIQQARLKLAPADQAKIRALNADALARLNDDQKRVFRAGGHVVLGVTPASGRPIGQLTGSTMTNADVEQLKAIDKLSQNLQAAQFKCTQLYPNIVVPPLPTNYTAPPPASLHRPAHQWLL